MNPQDCAIFQVLERRITEKLFELLEIRSSGLHRYLRDFEQIALQACRGISCQERSGVIVRAGVV